MSKCPSLDSLCLRSARFELAHLGRLTPCNLSYFRNSTVIEGVSAGKDIFSNKHVIEENNFAIWKDNQD